MPEREDLGGRPSQYDASFCGHVRRLARLNLPLTNAALAKYFGVCDRTIQRWKSQNPEFCRAVELAGLPFQMDVADRLYETAMGAEWTEQKAFKLKEIEYGANGKKLREVERIELVDVNRRAAPNVNAQQFFLRNHRPDVWREKLTLERYARTPEEEAERQAAMSADIRKLLPQLPDPETVKDLDQ